jgi:hypothetical protein
VGATRDSAPRTPQERVEDISRRLACPICDGESVFESRNADSQAIRIEIARQVDTGTVSDDQIINFIEQRFGSKVLLVREPPESTRSCGPCPSPRSSVRSSASASRSTGGRPRPTPSPTTTIADWSQPRWPEDTDL